MKINKLSNAVRGLWLLGNVNVFDTGIFDGKRIAIVGPATSAYGTGKGDYIDGFDYVIRINKAPLLLKDGTHRKDIGTKTDILFHSFFENDFSGGGLLDIALYEQLGITYLINPIPTFFGWRVTYNFYKKYLVRKTTYTLPYRPYVQMERRFKPFRPTTGFCALKAVIESRFDEFFITGFTFFKTGYVDGYRDPMKQADQAKAYISKMKIHNPDLEFEYFKELLGKNKEKKIRLDNVLSRILEDEK